MDRLKCSQLLSCSRRAKLLDAAHCHAELTSIPEGGMAHMGTLNLSGACLPFTLSRPVCTAVQRRCSIKHFRRHGINAASPDQGMGLSGLRSAGNKMFAKAPHILQGLVHAPNMNASVALTFLTFSIFIKGTAMSIERHPRMRWTGRTDGMDWAARTGSVQSRYHYTS